MKQPSHSSVCWRQAFDELLLMKRGGRIIFFGETGYRSQKVVEYYEVRLHPFAKFLLRRVKCSQVL